MKTILLLLAAFAGPALAGGSNYGVVPGALPQVQGKVTEWPVPTPKFARDPAPAPDGNIYIAVMAGNRIARFDTKTGKVTEFRAPSGGDPHTLVIDETGVIWFTVQNGQRIGRLDRATGKITEYKTSGNPYGLAIDKSGAVWFCRLGEESLGRLDPATGQITHLETGSGSRPRRVATAPDGMLWATLYGNGKLIKVDPVARRIVKEVAMPAGRGGGPYAVTVDAAGRVWANEIDTDTVALLEPKTEAFRVIALPSKNTGIRKAIIDAQGRYWYMGSHNGKLGVIE